MDYIECSYNIKYKIISLCTFEKSKILLSHVTSFDLIYFIYFKTLLTRFEIVNITMF